MERKFKGVWIPASIWLDERLSLTEKCLFAEIDSLAGNEEGCTASNLYLANFAQLSVRAVVNAIAKLNNLGLITITKSGSKHRIIVPNLNSSVINGKTYSAKNDNLQRKICAVQNSTAQNLPSINKVRKKEIKKEINNQAHVRESYNDIFDGFGVFGNYREALVDFIRHVRLNGNTMINSRLERLIIRLDREFGNDDNAKAVAIAEAIASGYKRMPCEYDA